MEQFQNRAITPNEAAASMIRGAERGTYLVFTSRDIRLGWYAQRYVPWVYNAIMRRLNTKMCRLLNRAPASRP